MEFPRFWSKSTTSVDTPDGRHLLLRAWGWGDDESAAHALAESRLKKITARIRAGDAFPEGYAYGHRPFREEVLETLDTEPDGAPAAVITRNRYGARVLNASGLLFLDLDVKPQTGMQRFLGLLGVKSGEREDEALSRIKRTLFRRRQGTFRLYRTAAGFRAIAIDRRFAPASEDTRALMEAAGTDPAYVRLCRAQGCFRARLTPKPWRCGLPRPPGDFPREARAEQDAFAAWLETYEATSDGYATCRYLDTIGTAPADERAARLVDVHDRLTRTDSGAPLA